MQSNKYEFIMKILHSNNYRTFNNTLFLLNVTTFTLIIIFNLITCTIDTISYYLF